MQLVYGQLVRRRPRFVKHYNDMCPKCHSYLAYPLSHCKGGRCPRCGYKPGVPDYVPPQEKKTKDFHRESRDPTFASRDRKYTHDRVEQESNRKDTGTSWFQRVLDVAIAIGAIIFIAITSKPTKRKR